MRLGPGEAALALRDAAAGVLSARVSPATIRAGWPGGDRRLVTDAWRTLAATGVIGTLVADDAGGLGLDETCLVPALEEVGRSGLPGPVVETIAVAAPVLGGRWLELALAGELTIAARLDSGDRGSGERGGGELIPHGQHADLVLLQAGDELRLYERRALALESCQTTDGSRGMARLTAPPWHSAQAPADPDAGSWGAAPPATATGTLLTDEPAVIGLAWQRGVLGTSALLTGLALRMLDMTVGYVKQREQFGRPVGSFQAIKHALADALVAVELARPAALAAAWALATAQHESTAQADAGARCSMAKVLAADAARLVARTALQCHGAIGYTTEHDLHLFAKRAWALIPSWGTPEWHRARLAGHLLAENTGVSYMSDSRVVIVTGAGQGLGREHALLLGAQGYRVVVNDIGDAAEAVAWEIRADGGIAIASLGDVSDWGYAESLIAAAASEFGTLDALVNNAGVNRDRMLVTMSEAEWDDVLRIDLKGHFAPLRHAAAYWRKQAKDGRAVSARIVNTSSGAGLMGSVGQGNYAAAKAGIAALTVVAAAELARYGITVNAIAPSARTPMTEVVFAARMRAPEGGFDAMHPGNVSPLVAWLASAGSGDVTGRMFEVEGGTISVADGWQHGPAITKDGRWEVAEIGGPLRGLLAGAPAPAGVYGT